MVETMANEFIPNCSGIETLDESVGSRGIYYRLGESEFLNMQTLMLLLAASR